MPKFEREVEIDSPVEKVWQVLTNPEHWPQWFPGVDSVSNVALTETGGTFEWTDEGRTGTGEITSLEPGKRMEVMTQLGDDKDLHIFTLRSSGGFFGLAADECKIEYKLDTLMGGGILASFIAGGNPKDALRVKKAVHALRKLVESL